VWGASRETMAVKIVGSNGECQGVDSSKHPELKPTFLRSQVPKKGWGAWHASDILKSKTKVRIRTRKGV